MEQDISVSQRPIICWFRRDLRLQDNPALRAAADTGQPVIPVYILDEESEGVRADGAAKKWWLDKSLKSLSADIERIGGQLVLKKGAARQVIEALLEETGANAVFWNRQYEKPVIDRDTEIKDMLKGRGVEAQSFNGSLLTEPWCIKTNSGGHYKVFTPYWKAVRATYSPPEPMAAPDRLAGGDVTSDELSAWGLHPSRPDWSKGFDPNWTPGEQGALDRLEQWLTDGLGAYDDRRNRPDVENSTSGLSAHLAMGEISPQTIWRAVRQAMQDGRRNIPENQAWTFLSELVWREFSYVLLYHYPDLHADNYNSDFNHMPWRYSENDLKAWQMGRTGYPMVDAGMRQLWQTGWMHNRVRMIVASFLTKHLLMHWHHGEEWFWDCLVDSDPASNAASWQWTAGSGADAAPYFRVFNPITQGPKFDESGAYVRSYVPELARLPDKYLHSPWEAPDDVLRKAGVKLGETYPHPIVAHKEGRQRALDAYDKLKEKRDAA